MFRLAHISDIHLGPLPSVRKRDLVSKRITGYINWQRNRGKQMAGDWLRGLVDHIHANGHDHIAVTGDLVNLALAEEVEAARGWLETVGPPLDVSVVPGNHDAYVPGALARVRKAWGPYMTGDRDRGERVTFPYLRRRGPAALIGVNSGRATAPFMSTGSYRSAQDHELRALLKSTRDAFRVVMIHHPPFKDATDYSKRLIGSSRFRAAILECGAELVLHGHTHIVSHESVPGPEGPVPVVGVPSASAGLRDSDPRPAARYNRFEIEGEPGAWRCIHSEHGYAAGGAGVHEIASRELSAQARV